MNKDITVTLNEKSHKHAEMMIHKAANPELVVFVKLDGGWVISSGDLPWSYDSTYYLCHPNHTKECLHCLNGGTVQHGFDRYKFNNDFGWTPGSIFMKPGIEITIKQEPEPEQEPEYVKVEGDANDAYRAMLDGETLYYGEDKQCCIFDEGTFIFGAKSDVEAEVLNLDFYGFSELYRKVERGE